MKIILNRAVLVNITPTLTGVKIENNYFKNSKSKRGEKCTVKYSNRAYFTPAGPSLPDIFPERRENKINRIKIAKIAPSA